MRAWPVGVALATVVTMVASLVAAVPAQAARAPIVMTAPAEAPAFSTFPLEVVVPRTTAPNAPTRRTATLSASRDGTTFAPLSTWRVGKAGGRKAFTIQAGEVIGRVWLRTVVTGTGLKPPGEPEATGRRLPSASSPRQITLPPP